VLRLDTWFRTNKSRRLKRLHESKEWKQASPVGRKAQETAVIDEVIAEKEKRQDELEIEWTKKVEANGLDEDEVEPEGEGELSVDNDVEVNDDEEDWLEEGIPGAEVEEVIKEHGATWKSLIERLENEATGRAEDYNLW
jgi:hypothetical protein